MKNKKLLAIISLSLIFCFVSGVGYGEIPEWVDEATASYIDLKLLDAKVSYMMTNKTSFLGVSFYYDPTGTVYNSVFPSFVDTKRKIVITVYDDRDRFSFKSGINLLDSFKKTLKAIYSFVNVIATDMDTDIVAIFFSEEEIRLGYFSEGEYHLWED